MLVLVFLFSACDKETILDLHHEVPAEIASYVSTHFPDHQILQLIKDVDGLKKTYDLILEGNVKLEFNRKKEIIEIDSDIKLPDSVIPEKIRIYVEENYPYNYVTDWELEGRNQQIGLDNGLDLIFSMNGDFIRIDG